MKITTEDIQVGFHARQILKGISIESKDKELVGIIGPNGSGKSTLLKCIYRILKPDAGAVYLDGEELHSMSVKSSARKMAVVAQHNYYNFDFTVREVVLMGRAPHKKALERDNAKDYRIVEEALKTVQMNAFAVVSDSGTLPEESSFFMSVGCPFPAVCIRTSTERPEALDKACFVLAGIDERSLLQAVDTAVQMNLNEDYGIPVPDYVEENVSSKVVKIIQSYTGVINKMVWRKF